MAIDGKLLAKARNALEGKRKESAEKLERRIAEVYAKVPRIRELDMELRATMAELVGISLGMGDASQIDGIREKNTKIQKERKEALTAAGFAPNYLDEEYFCKKCSDTGHIDSKMCDCLMALYKEEQKSSLSSLLKLGDETFESFELSFYDDSSTPETGISPRKSMEVVYEICTQYAKNFGPKSMNLFFNGAPGLGKTFLSACIARVVADRGYSVVYDMAGAMFSKFEDAKFQKAENPGETRDEIKRYLECDLLIIDDLGTEMTTTFTISALYEIINTRLVTAKKTLVNSNMTIDEMRRRYSEQIMSRLEGEYQVLTFYGDDIRKKRNNLC
ncbi:MAG: ATP-binding protein [Oscillospiraceae bacterium]|nr:ATP-binding protein [Oscillospiraceae bacterium]